MGATNVGFTMKGNKTKTEINAEFERQREEAIYEHGHDSYNGTISTIPKIKFTDKIFDTEDEASEYCLDNAEKWSHAIACKYKDKNGELMWLIEGWAAE